MPRPPPTLIRRVIDLDASDAAWFDAGPDDELLRSELYSLEQLEEHARALAGTHRVQLRAHGDQILTRLGENEVALTKAYRATVLAANAGRRVPPAAEWLLDHFYLVEEQIRTARRHLPRGYSRELPRLLDGPHAGYPRVYVIALELISHIDGRVDAESVAKFVSAYQSTVTLTLGELWAIPIMLRLALIENLRRIGQHLARSLHQRQQAGVWADRLIALAEKSPSDLVQVVAELSRTSRSQKVLTPSFIAEFTRRLQGLNPALGVATTWLEQRLDEDNTTTEQVVQGENQLQAIDQVSIGNSITSLRSLSNIDWRGFVESLSVVDRTLRSEPAGIYARMDFTTRDAYRHVVEDIAKRSLLSEPHVAEQAVALTRKQHTANPTAREAHVGYVLVDHGRAVLERAVTASASPWRQLGETLKRRPLASYLGGAALLSVLAWVVSYAWIGIDDLNPINSLAVAVLVGLVASQWALTCVNWLVTTLLTPRTLPRLDFADGIPAEHRTMVVIPTLLRRPSDVEHLLEGLEVRHLANPDQHLDFALLTDFGDAARETMPEDEALLALAIDGIKELNHRYVDHRRNIFFLFHRPRRWNAQERVWMGWERKRGKLEDLNALLLHGERSRFAAVVGEISVFADIRYIITLDTDTQLPRDAARELVGTLAHPLNRPRFAADGRISDGYAILQPRAAISLPSASKSWFARIFSGEPGIDPYSRAVSDVYQDLFHEGSFVGKGIYDLAAFQRAVGTRFPENRVLSHDLIEGSYARAALVSDVMVFEDHPARYTADVTRRQRWTRGDWQLLPWLLPRVRDASGKRVTNSLSLLARWKLADNLRRSLVAPATLMLLIGGWTVLPGGGAFWVLLVLAFTYSPLALTTLVNLLRKVSDVPWGMHLKNQADSFGVQVAQATLGLVFLPYEAVTTLDAIIRTSGRMFITRRRLLEWQTASDAERNAKTTLAGLTGAMWSAPAVALTTAALTIACAPGDLHDALPLLALWFCSPALAWLISQPLKPAAHNLQPKQVQFLGRAARKTWRFFETFVGADDNFLPPDNYQEYPASVVAHRTSPTNIGLALLANVAAHDLGYVPLPRLLERTGQTLGTMAGMERHRGHFYNWYDTRTAKAIQPFYVSMVDSGNLAGHLLTLRSGLGELADQPILHTAMFSGLRQTLNLLSETATGAGAKAAGGWSTRLGEFAKLWSDLDRDLRSPPRTVNAALALLNRLIAVGGDFVTNVATASDDELRWWAGAFEQGSRDHRDHLLHIAPWSQLPPAPDVLWRLDAGPADRPQHLATLRTELARLDQTLTLADIAGFAQGLSPQLDFFLDEHGQNQDPAVRAAVAWINALRTPVHQACERATQLITRSTDLAAEAGSMAEMEWGFLFDRSRELFAIGYNVAEHRLDGSFYDLLASEARLGSFVAIAQGQVSQDHWFALGRLLTASHSAPALLSWAGSMFEYLMPMLVMPSHEGTLLDQTCRAVIRRQIDYGRQRGVPWGISESGYNLTDGALNYQYRAFGVPGLGLKRGLSDDLVIAPYASAMALMVAPEAACANLQRIAAAGHEGPYGFYEAIDFTPARVPRGATAATVRSFMVHHQGMALLGLLYVLADRPMQRRFTSDPLIKSTELLLQERVPKTVPVVYPHAAEAGTTRKVAATPEATTRVFTNPGMAVPEVQLLSNGRYQVLITSAGGGYSRWKDLAVNRWREDATRDAHGVFCYLRDVERGEVWSTTWQPTLAQPDRYEAVFTQGRAEFRRSDHEIEACTEIAVSPEDDVELRRTTLTNRSRVTRVIEVTTYAECVLAPPTAEAAHPAFSNLFVQTRLIGDAILCNRRPRKANDPTPWLVHLMRVHGNEIGKPSFETARATFIGRGRSPAAPLAMRQSGALSGTTGPVLDPIVAIRRTINLQPDESAVIDVVLGVTDTEADARELASKYRDRRLADRVLSLSWTHSQVVLGQLGASEADAQLYGRLTSSVVFANPLRRANAALLANNRQGQSGLWSYGISGDLPIVLLKITDAAKMDLVRQLVNAHAYWRLNGMAVDLVIWNEDHSVYRQAINDEIVGLVASGPEAAWLDKPGGIFVRRADQMSEEDRVLLQTVARAVISDNTGTLAQFVERRARPELPLPRLAPSRTQRTEQLPTPPQSPRDLLFANGLGGFSRDGREYVIVLGPDQTTPAPWVNVMANAGFGTVVSESGSAYTWGENSHEFRLTPWNNDAVTDDGGEALYLRDEESGRFWSPTPWPARAGAYTVRHGFGYSVFSHQHAGLATELTVFVASDAPVKLARLRIRNLGARPRRLSVTGYNDWVLGELRHKSAPFVVTEIDGRSGAIIARNPYNTGFAGRVAFSDASEPLRTVTCDRGEFIGRNGSLSDPAALGRTRLSGRIGAGLDPCAAIQVQIELAEGQEREVVFVLGAAASIAEAQTLAQRFRSPVACQRALDAVHEHWQRVLGTVQVETPEPALDVLANGWLLYQVLSCRFWARTGFYQSGGAFGYRDQLQDTMALVHAEPTLAREHILRCAAHQFRDGDVQHWWHPPIERGVRTRFSDDFLWLPLAVSRYIETTGDSAVLAEEIAFLDGRQVRDDEEGYYDLATVGDEKASLYVHCQRAIERGMRTGAHGLPLMGCGDWNDGMNLVGIHGKGESVWLGFFLCDVLTRFIPLARERGDGDFAERCATHIAKLKTNLEAEAWDGAWYRRAWFDDGTVLGSASSPECRIDSLPQSWAVLSGVGDPERARTAMQEVDRQLVRRDAGLVQLFDPPFDRSALDPGYIKGYLPGVRENGGQYTHAALWTVMAFAQLGDAERAWELFRLINPVLHADSPQRVATYQVEPYVVAADVYGVAPHTGRGGWTWYTGSAGWMYRLAVESLLGLRRDGDSLRLTPCLPRDWAGFTLRYRFRDTTYRIAVHCRTIAAVTLDGVVMADGVIRLVNDRQEHVAEVSVVVGQPRPA